jgi:hypothetical protein
MRAANARNADSFGGMRVDQCQRSVVDATRTRPLYGSLWHRI